MSVSVYVIARFVGDSAWLSELARRPGRVTKTYQSRARCREGNVEVLALGHMGHAYDQEPILEGANESTLTLGPHGGAQVTKSTE
jgi:hypothetical protein